MAAFISSIAALALGIYALRWRRPVNIVFSLFMFILALWQLSSSLTGLWGKLLMTKVGLAALVFLPPVFLHLAVLHPPKETKVKRLPLLLFYLFPSTAFLALLGTNFFVQGFRGEVILGPAYPFFFLNLMIYLYGGLAFLSLSFLRSEKGERKYIAYILLPSAPVIISSTLFDLAVHTFPNTFCAPFFILLMVVMIAYTQFKHGVLSPVEKIPEIGAGKGYIILEKKPITCYKILAGLIEGGIPALCITRENPEGAARKTSANVVWLSGVEYKNSADPSDLESLLKMINDFLSGKSESVIFLDGVEYLIVQRSFSVVLRFIAALRETVTASRSRLLIAIDPRALDERELSGLAREGDLEMFTPLPKKIKHTDFQPGYCYLVKTENPMLGLEIISKLTDGSPGLCITRENPSNVRKKLKEIPVVWLSDTKVTYESCIAPTNLELLLKIIGDFSSSKQGAILLDGIEHLIAQRDYATVLKFIHALHDIVVLNKAKLIVTINPSALDEKKMALISRDMLVLEI